jgi:hypothetical protein
VNKKKHCKMDASWSLGWGWEPSKPGGDPNSPPQDHHVHHHQNRPVGLFLDLSNLWVEGTRCRENNRLSVIAEDLHKLASDFTTHDTIDMMHSVVVSGQLREREENSLEALRFYTDQVNDASEAFEVMSNAILIWLWDQARASATNQFKSSPRLDENSEALAPQNEEVDRELDPCVVLVTSNPRFGPLIAKLRRRGVFVLLVTELSGYGQRQPVPFSLRKDASVLYDWNEVCLLLERFGGPPSDDSEEQALDEMEEGGDILSLSDSGGDLSSKNDVSPRPSESDDGKVPLTARALAEINRLQEGSAPHLASLNLGRKTRVTSDQSVMTERNKKKNEYTF